MKKEMNLIVAFFIALCLYTVAQDVPKLRIDPAQAYGGNTSNYFDGIEYIPLETKKESLFGDVRKLFITDSVYFVFDYDTNKILIFNKKGKYKSSYKLKKNEYTSFNFNASDRLVEVSIFNFEKEEFKTIQFTIQGNFIGEKIIYSAKNIETGTYYKINNVFMLELNTCYNYFGKQLYNDTVYLIKTYIENKLNKSLLPVNPKENVVFCTLGFGGGTLSYSNDTNKIYFCPLLYNSVYEISADTAIEKYKFIFPSANSLPSSVMNCKNLNSIDSLKKIYLNRTDVVLGVQNLQFFKKYLLFNLMYYKYVFNGMSNDLQSYNFIYDFENQKLIALERMMPDFISFFLPIIDGIGSSTIGLVRNGDHLYSSISSLKLFNAYEATKNKNPQYPAILQQYFKTQNRKSNPVIVKMKLKDF